MQYFYRLRVSAHKLDAWKSLSSKAMIEKKNFLVCWMSLKFELYIDAAHLWTELVKRPTAAKNKTNCAACKNHIEPSVIRTKLAVDTQWKISVFIRVERFPLSIHIQASVNQDGCLHVQHVRAIIWAYFFVLINLMRYIFFSLRRHGSM